MVLAERLKAVVKQINGDGLVYLHRLIREQELECRMPSGPYLLSAFSIMKGRTISRSLGSEMI
jgi:hypothetical protein